MNDAGDFEQFDEIAQDYYRGYIIIVSARGLSTFDPDMKYQIYQTKKSYIDKIYLYDSSKDVYIRDDYEYVIRQAREWIDMYETFNRWI